uniref:Uncharacterized protein n=1 Tax=Rhizophora mucronata TaxID=61149 RepID=A0A2P2J814_RHIMU
MEKTSPPFSYLQMFALSNNRNIKT